MKVLPALLGLAGLGVVGYGLIAPYVGRRFRAALGMGKAALPAGIAPTLVGSFRVLGRDPGTNEVLAELVTVEGLPREALPLVTGLVFRFPPEKIG